MATSLKTRTTGTTMATRIGMMQCCVWLGLCLTPLADARLTGGSAGRYYGSGGSGTGIGTGYTSTAGTSNYYGSDSSMNGYNYGDDSNSYSNSYTSTSTGVGVGTGGRGGGGGSGISVFFGNRHRTTTNGDNSYNDDPGPPVVFIILFWLMVVLVIGACCYCCAVSARRDSPEYQKSSFDSRVANAKDQVKRHGASTSQNKSAGGAATDDVENNNNNNISRPPADGSYVATYTLQGRAVSTTMNLYFSPNIQDSNTSWYIVGRGKCTDPPSSVAMTGVDDNAAACQEFKITEGVISESGHAYWVQQKQDASNDRSLTTGKFEFDPTGSSNWCSFTGSILTRDGDQAEYTSFQLEKDCVVVHAVALPPTASSSATTTDVESNGEDDVEFSY